MCRLIGWVAREPVTMRELLGDDAVARLLHLSTVHCHGWGVAWRDGDRLRVRRSPDQASRDPGFATVLDSLATTAAVVHLRLATPGFDRLITDTHPFSDGQWALAHNGAISPGTRVGELLTPGSPAPQGTTDSERWFLALRDAYDRLGDDADADTGQARRLATATSSVLQRARSAGLTSSSWNSLVLGPEALFAVNHHDDSWQPADIPVWPSDAPGPVAGWPPYFDLRLRDDDGARTVISSGVVDDTAGWEMLPNHSVLRLGFPDSKAECVDIG
jgi:predicted glutamine amidotransferase